MDLNFITRQFATIPYPTTSLASQTLIVTGANTGLGLEAAKHFVRMGASKVILACRSPQKGLNALHLIEGSTKRTGILEVWQLDMEDFSSIKDFAAKAEKLERIDAVVENAGLSFVEWTWSEKAGMETTIAVNVVGTFLLALLMLPILRRSGKRHGIVPRLTVVSSDVHMWAKFAERHEESIFEALKKNSKPYVEDRYNVSKILDVFMVRALAEHIASGPHAGEKVIINTVNPGLCHSDLGRSVSGIQAAIFSLVKKILARTTEVGGRTLVAGAVAGEESNGCYMSEAVVKEPSAFVRSEEGRATQERVYKELMDILEELCPGAKTIV